MDFRRVRAAMQRAVDDRHFAGLSLAVLRGGEPVFEHCAGWADLEAGEALRPDHVFRIFSSTKLATSAAALRLWDEGRFDLDDAVERWLPALAGLRVLRAGATRLEDSVPVPGPVTVRHLLTHSAGFGLGFFEPDSLLKRAYAAHGVRDRDAPMATLVERLGRLPLLFEPGTAWDYSVATDVLGRLVEVWSGLPLDVYFEREICAPLGLVDTGFLVPPAQQHRLVAFYRGADAADPQARGLARDDAAPYPGAYRQPAARLSGGGGLASTLGDNVKLVQSLLPGGAFALRPQTLALATRNHLPPGLNVLFAQTGVQHGVGHGLMSAVDVRDGASHARGRAGDWWWGGAAGTQWWVSPSRGIAGVLMAQRALAFFHPIAHELKDRVAEVFD